MDIPVEDQIACFMAGFGAIVTLCIPYIVMHYARRAKNVEI